MEGLAVDVNWIATLQFDEKGLIPAVIQDASTNAVLMVAYMNEESLRRTLETRQTWFWSRSRGELWHKGATSGHTQQVVELKYDCDADTLLVRVEQQGAACHTGAYSCFFGEGLADRGADRGADRYQVLEALIATISQRHAERPEGAYTTYLFDKGLDKILKKIGEESTEVVIAAKNNDPTELIAEAGDLIYHLLVLLQQQEIPFARVLDLLQERHGEKDIAGKVPR